jgi:Sec-independent protein translocase protein TatA
MDLLEGLKRAMGGLKVFLRGLKQENAEQRKNAGRKRQDRYNALREKQKQNENRVYQKQKRSTKIIKLRMLKLPNYSAID